MNLDLEAAVRAAGFAGAAEARTVLRSALGWPRAGTGALCYVSPDERPLTRGERDIRRVAFALREAQPWAVAVAAARMAPFVPPGAVLVPVPSSLGSVEANLALAQAISERTGARVLQAIRRRAPVTSSRMIRREGYPSPLPEGHGFEATGIPLPRGPILFIDNVMTTGSTFEAARLALGHRGQGLAYARSMDFRSVLRVARLPPGVADALMGAMVSSVPVSMQGVVAGKIREGVDEVLTSSGNGGSGSCRINTWFERDRAMVSLQRADGTEVVTWWDGDVRELVEDGFLNPRDWLGSAVAYARHLGLLSDAE